MTSPPSGETPGPAAQWREAALRFAETTIDYGDHARSCVGAASCDCGFEEVQKEANRLYDAYSCGEPSPDPVREAARLVSLLCEDNGQPVDGFRFREAIVELRNALGEPHPQPERRTE